MISLVRALKIPYKAHVANKDLVKHDLRNMNSLQFHGHKRSCW